MSRNSKRSRHSNVSMEKVDVTSTSSSSSSSSSSCCVDELSSALGVAVVDSERLEQNAKKKLELKWELRGIVARKLTLQRDLDVLASRLKNLLHTHQQREKDHPHNGGESGGKIESELRKRCSKLEEELTNLSGEEKGIEDKLESLEKEWRDISKCEGNLSVSTTQTVIHSLNSTVNDESILIQQPKDDFSSLCYRSAVIDDHHYDDTNDDSFINRLNNESSGWNLLNGTPTHEISDNMNIPSCVWDSLYDFQRTALEWISGLFTQQVGGILADEMGLGKTVVIASFLCALHHTQIGFKTQNEFGSSGILIVCPASLLDHWMSELHIWAPMLRICLYHAKADDEMKRSLDLAANPEGVLLTTYETLRRRLKPLLEKAWKYIILDEGQKIRNPNSNITLCLKQFNTPHRLLLSGSPIQNSLTEFWSLFDFIYPGRLGTLASFQQIYADPIKQGSLAHASKAKKSISKKTASALKEVIDPYVLRRTKASLMEKLKLPQKSEKVLFVNLTNEQYWAYTRFLEQTGIREAIATSSRKRCHLFFALNVLRKICNHPDLLLPESSETGKLPSFQRSGKLKVLYEILKVWVAKQHRILVFCQTIKMLDKIESMVSIYFRYLRMDGSTPIRKRSKIVEKFNNSSDFNVFLLTTKVGGVGLNLTGADRLVLFDPDWNPMTDIQARERCWRIGQKKEVQIYRLITAGTLEEKIYQRQIYKFLLSRKILDNPGQHESAIISLGTVCDFFDVPPPSTCFAETPTVSRYQDRILNALSSAVDQSSKLVDEAVNNDESCNIQQKSSSDEHDCILGSLSEYNIIQTSSELIHSEVMSFLLVHDDNNDGESSKIEDSYFTQSQPEPQRSFVPLDIVSFMRTQVEFRAKTAKILDYFNVRLRKNDMQAFKEALYLACTFETSATEDGSWALRDEFR